MTARTSRTRPARVSHRVRAAAAALAVAATAAGCTAQNPPAAPEVASPFAGCTAISAAPAGAPADLPDLSLPCFTGGQAFALTSLRGPAVVNLWASWCPPCRAELPAIQRLADRTAGELTVISVDTRDDREAAASFATDAKVTLPTLFDPGQKLHAAVGGTALPITVFVDASGRRTVHPLPIRGEADLTALVREHTGVAS